MIDFDTQTVKVLLNADNTNGIALKQKGALLPAVLPISPYAGQLSYASITRVQVRVSLTLIDSATSPTLFDLTQPDKILLVFGNAPLAAGTYDAKLRVFTAASVHGLDWINFNLIVEDGS